MKLSKFVKLVVTDNKSCLAINTLYRNVLIVSSKVLKCLRKKQLERIPANELKRLREENILVEEKENELNEFLFWLNSIKFDFSTIKAVFVLTTKCNLACTYCYEEGYLKKDKRSMSKNTAKEIIDWLMKLAEIRKTKLVELCFYGGEPTLELDLMEFIAKNIKARAKYLGIKTDFYLYSNGILLNKKIAEKLSSAGISAIQLTLDGPPSIHDKRRPFINGKPTFNIIYENLKDILKNTSIKILLNVNFDEENYSCIEDLIKLLKKDGLSKISQLELSFASTVKTPKNYGCQHAISENSFAKEWANLYEQTIQQGFNCNPLRIFSKGPCTYRRASHYVFDTNGDIYKCIGLIGIREYVIGNIKEGLSNNFVKKLAMELSNEVWQNNECLNCEYLPLCLGGCRYLCYLTKNNITERYCHKELIEKCELELIKYFYLKNRKTNDEFYEKGLLEAYLTVAPKKIKEFIKKEDEFLIKTIPKNSTILDVGCGFGRHVKLLAEQGNKIVGIDYNGCMLKKAKEYLKGINNTELYLENAKSIHFKGKEFDFVICMLNTFGDQGKQKNLVLKEMKRVLKPEGKIIISVWSEKALKERIKAYRNVGIKIEKIEGQKIKLKNSHTSEALTEKQLKNLFNKMNLSSKIIKITELGYIAELSMKGP